MIIRALFVIRGEAVPRYLVAVGKGRPMISNLRWAAEREGATVFQNELLVGLWLGVVQRTDAISWEKIIE